MAAAVRWRRRELDGIAEAGQAADELPTSIGPPRVSLLTPTSTTISHKATGLVEDRLHLFRRQPGSQPGPASGAARVYLPAFSTSCSVTARRIRVVFTQMTKADVLTLAAGGQHVPDFDLVVRDDDPVNQQQHELPTLLEGGIHQPVLHPLTKGLQGSCDPG